MDLIAAALDCLRAVCVATLVAACTGCATESGAMARRAFLESRPAEAAHSTIDCGETHDNAERWRLIEYRSARESYLWFERQRRQADGTWSSVGGVGHSLAAVDGIRRRARDLTCFVSAQGVEAKLYAEANRWENSYPLTLRVSADYRLEVVLGPVLS